MGSRNVRSDEQHWLLDGFEHLLDDVAGEVARKGGFGGGGHHQQRAVVSLDQVDDCPRRMVVVGDGVAVVRPAVVRSSPSELEDVEIVGEIGR
jgi:hypothetical protein